MNLRVEYDEAQDVLKVEGVRYSGSLFRHFDLAPSAPDILFRIVNRNPDGVVILQTVHDSNLVKHFERLLP